MKSSLLEKSFRILDRIASSPAPVTLKELASDLELNASTVSRIASDLAAHNLIRKAGYHSFVPSTGLIRLGLDALDTPLLRGASALMRERVSELGVNGWLAGLDAGRSVCLCTCGTGSVERPLPPPWDSPLVAVILGCRDGLEQAERFFALSLAERLPRPDRASVRELFLRRCRAASERGFLAEQDPRRGWSVSFPVPAGTDMYGVSLYGAAAENRSIDRMQFECSRLASRLSSLLNERRQGRYEV